MKVIDKPKHGSEEWLRLRWRDEEGNCLFGASDAPALMGSSPYTSRADLFVNKMSVPEAQPDNEAFRRGNVLEPVLLVEASRILDKEIFTPSKMYRKDRFIVSLDGVDNWQKPTVVVEAKTTNKYSIQSSKDLPAEWLWQGMAQQFVLQVPVWFTVLDRELRFSVVEMPENKAGMDALKMEAEIFAELVETGKPTPSDLNNFSAEQIAKVFLAEPTSIELGEIALEWLLQLESARTAKKRAEEHESQAKDELARLLLNNEIGTFKGEKILSWKEQQGKTSLDVTKLRNDLPDLVKEYEKQGQPYRVMRTHTPKGK